MSILGNFCSDSKLSCTSLPNYNIEGGTPLCGGGSVQSWLSAAGDTGGRRQETGDRPRNTGHRRELGSGNYCWPRSPHSSCRLRQSAASTGSRDPAPPIGGRGAGAGAGAGQVRGCKNRHCLGGQESGHPVHSRLAFSQQRDNSHRQGE